MVIFLRIPIHSPFIQAFDLEKTGSRKTSFTDGQGFVIREANASLKKKKLGIFPIVVKLGKKFNFSILYMGSKKCFNAKKIFRIF